jgi:hypothetical protein
VAKIVEADVANLRRLHGLLVAALELRVVEHAARLRMGENEVVVPL